MPRFSPAEWQAEQARATAFPMTDVSAALQHWWRDVVRSEPDDVIVTSKKHSGSVQGTYGPGTLVLKTEPGRVDWLLVPAEAAVQESVRAGEVPSVGAAVKTTETFSEIVERWLSLDDLPVVSRIAFGAVLNHPEVNREAAYQRLPDYVPVQLPPGSSDFLFQINRPQRSATGIEGLTINRLTKWNVVSLKIVPSGVIPASFETFNFRIELDINTAPTVTELIPRERLVEVYRELVSEGMQIAANGL